MIEALKRIFRQNAILRKARSKRAVLLVCGHHRASWTHGRDPGAVAHGTNEHWEMEKVVHLAAKQLRIDGFNAVYAPFTYNLAQKVQWANSYPQDSVLLSCHMNSSFDNEISGSEIWMYSGNKEMEHAAFRSSEILSKTLNVRNRGVKGDLQNGHGRLAILRDTIQMDELLLEMGFISNKSDLEKVRATGAQAVIDIVKQVFYKDVWK